MSCCYCKISASRNEEEMYKVLLSDYEQRQKQLLVENAELKKVLQQMKKEIISLLPPQKQKPKERCEDGPVSILQLKLNLHGSLVQCWSNLIIRGGKKKVNLLQDLRCITHPMLCLKSVHV